MSYQVNHFYHYQNPPNSLGVSKHSSTFTGSETAANLNSANAKTVTVKAKWKSNCTENCSDLDLSINESVGFSYTGAVKGVTLKKAGYYKLEVWGAQGGVNQGSSQGFGGYSYGVYSASKDGVVYVVVGGQGTVNSSCGTANCASGGYNGGGVSLGYNDRSYSASGGGATHIATRTGMLSSLSSYQSSVLIVAGGGGGSGKWDANTSTGGNGGGYIGGKGGENTTNYLGGYGGTQSSGGSYDTNTNNCVGGSYGSTPENGSFGLGAGNHYTSGGGCSACGGGGGWYGGGAGSVAASGGGGGSGYIGNSLLLSTKGVTKQMYQYSTGCTSSTAAATKTTCTSSTGAHTANAANTGNGYAKITYLGT